MAQPGVQHDLSASRRLAVLAAAARALHGEPDLNRVLHWSVEAAGEITDLPWTALCLLPRHGSPIWYERPDSAVHFGVLGDPRAVPVLAPALVGDTNALRLEDLAAADRARPPADSVRRVLTAERLLAVPVVGADRQVRGLILLADAEVGPFQDDAVSAVVALAAHLAVALDNHATLAHLAEVEARGREVVHQLQEAVRPPAPVVPFAELGVHYVAADPDEPTGGDLYDWVVLPDGDLHLAVVDVMGKGVEATKHALAVTHALRLLAVEGCPLEQMVQRADALVTAQNPDLVATVVVARYRPSDGHTRLAGAGHPPALVVSGGVPREVAAPGIAIGWPGAGSHLVVELALERSDTLILYTDGLIEATKDILAGLEQLASAAAAIATYPANSLARALVERQLADASRQDDSVALVLRRRTPPPPARTHLLGPLVHRFSPAPAAVSVARHFLLDWLDRMSVEAEDKESLLLVASELCSNAVRHATGAPGGVVLRASAEGSSVVLEVEDDGGELTWPSMVADELPDPEADRGRGLFLVETLSDEVTSRTEGNRTVVRAVRWAVIADREPAARAGGAPASPPFQPPVPFRRA